MNLDRQMFYITIKIAAEYEEMGTENNVIVSGNFVRFFCCC